MSIKEEDDFKNILIAGELENYKHYLQDRMNHIYLNYYSKKIYKVWS